MTLECGQNLLQDIRRLPELEIQNHRRDCNTRQTEKLYKTIQSYTALSVYKRKKKKKLCPENKNFFNLLSRFLPVGNQKLITKIEERLTPRTICSKEFQKSLLTYLSFCCRYYAESYHKKNTVHRYLNHSLSISHIFGIYLCQGGIHKAEKQKCKCIDKSIFFFFFKLITALSTTEFFVPFFSSNVKYCTGHIRGCFYRSRLSRVDI